MSQNLACLQRMLEFNRHHNLLFLRLSSDIIPFASHPICQIDWPTHFGEQLTAIGAYIRQNQFRISMHPDQFVLLNSPHPHIIAASIAELQYHQKLLDSLGLDDTAKIQIHVGGVYGDKVAAVERFIRVYQQLPLDLRRRLVIENDERLFSVRDCLTIHNAVGVPILFDYFHHQCLNNHEDLDTLLKAVFRTWRPIDGIPMVDYSSQQPGMRIGKHAASIDLEDFIGFLHRTRAYDYDLMLEIKDKEKSALKALSLVMLHRPEAITT